MVITRTIIVRERRGPWVPFFSACEMTLINRHAQPSIIIWENDELAAVYWRVCAAGHDIQTGVVYAVRSIIKTHYTRLCHCTGSRRVCITATATTRSSSIR